MACIPKSIKIELSPQMTVMFGQVASEQLKIKSSLELLHKRISIIEKKMEDLN